MILFIAALVTALDQLSKYVIRATMLEGASIPIVKGAFYITHVQNTGAAFGLFTNRPVFLIVVGLVIIGSVAAYYFSNRPTRPVVKIALGLELGGAVGNLVDRVVSGRVTDFLDLHRLWPVFNLADSAIVCGAVLLVLALLLFQDGWRVEKTKVGD